MSSQLSPFELATLSMPSGKRYSSGAIAKLSQHEVDSSMDARAECFVPDSEPNIQPDGNGRFVVGEGSGGISLLELTGKEDKSRKLNDSQSGRNSSDVEQERVVSGQHEEGVVDCRVWEAERRVGFGSVILSTSVSKAGDVFMDKA